MAYFMFNFNEPQSSLLYSRGRLLSKELKSLVRKELKEEPKHRLSRLTL